MILGGTSLCWQAVQDRGPRYAVIAFMRPREGRVDYADTGERAERIYDQRISDGHHQVHIYPPDGSIDLGELGRARVTAIAAEREATGILRAAVLRALEAGRTEAEVARAAGVDRMTVRKWAGK